MLSRLAGADERTAELLRYVMIGIGAWVTFAALQPYAYGLPIGYRLFPFFAIAVLCFALPGQVRFAVGALCALTLSYISIRSNISMIAGVQAAMSIAALALAVINRHIAVAAVLAIGARILPMVG